MITDQKCQCVDILSSLKSWRTIDIKVLGVEPVLHLYFFYTINASSCAGTGHWFMEINCVLQNHPMNVRINFRESGLALCNLSIKIADTNRKQDGGKLADIN